MELNDDTEVRCPILGGTVTYKYCKTMDKDGCPSIPVCFEGILPDRGAAGRE